MIENLDKKIQEAYENTNALYPLLREIGEGAGGGSGGVVINPKANDTSLEIGGVTYAVPTLDADELVVAYNALIAGTGCSVSNKAGTSYFAVLQADSIQSVGIHLEFFGIATLEYHMEGSTVEISAIQQGGAELLWENANPNITFSPQNISIEELMSFSYIMIEFKALTTTTTGKPIYFSMCDTEHFGTASNGLPSVPANGYDYRELAVSSGNTNKIYFGAGGYCKFSGEAVINNTFMVPKRIFGFKF